MSVNVRPKGPTPLHGGNAALCDPDALALR
jgi:hypothetical protein